MARLVFHVQNCGSNGKLCVDGVRCSVSNFPTKITLRSSKLRAGRVLIPPTYCSLEQQIDNVMILGEVTGIGGSFFASWEFYNFREYA